MRNMNQTQIGFLLLITCFFCFFLNNGFTGPSIMEARNFITAREILQNDTWLIPTMNGELRLAKPPLPTWITAFSGYLAGNIHNEVALRIPAAIMATIMILFMYKLIKVITEDKTISLLGSMILATSFYVVYLGRQGTWDIYCHSYMLGAIWMLAAGWKKADRSYKEFIVAGILMGLSFMSKGPVSFYALLLPFLISYLVGFDGGKVKEKWRELLVALFICIAISSWWPIYTYINAPAELIQNITTETGSWRNRHVRPFWHYWSFPIQSGIWTLFITVSLLFPYAKKRIGEVNGNYKFLIWWVLSTIVLLSLIPEKKERYLMPGLISQALLTAFYLKYLIVGFQKNELTLSDRIVLVINTGLFSLICLSAPVGLYLFGYTKNAIPAWVFICCSLILLLFGAFFLVQFWRSNAVKIVGATFALMCFLSSSSPYLISKMFPKDVKKKNMLALTHIKSIQNLPYYSIGELRPEELWDVRKVVKPLDKLDQLTLHKDDSIVLFQIVNEDSFNKKPQDKSDNHSRVLGIFEHPSKRVTGVWMVSVVNPLNLSHK